MDEWKDICSYICVYYILSLELHSFSERNVWRWCAEQGLDKDFCPYIMLVEYDDKHTSFIIHTQKCTVTMDIYSKKKQKQKCTY